MIRYTREEIEEFIQVNKNIEKESHSAAMEKLLSIYHKIKIFQGLSKNDLKAIIYDAKFQKFNHGEFITKEGRASNTIYYLIEGECKIHKNSTKIATVKKEQTFGDNGLLIEPSKRIASVIVASERAVVLSFKIDHTNIEFGSQALLMVYQNIMKQLSEKLQEIKFA